MKENRMLPIGTETFRIFVDEAEDGVIRGGLRRDAPGGNPIPKSFTPDPAFGRADGYRAARRKLLP